MFVRLVVRGTRYISIPMHISLCHFRQMMKGGVWKPREAPQRKGPYCSITIQLRACGSLLLLLTHIQCLTFPFDPCPLNLLPFPVGRTEAAPRYWVSVMANCLKPLWCKHLGDRQRARSLNFKQPLKVKLKVAWSHCTLNIRGVLPLSSTVK